MSGLKVIQYGKLSFHVPVFLLTRLVAHHDVCSVFEGGGIQLAFAFSLWYVPCRQCLVGKDQYC